MDLEFEQHVDSIEAQCGSLGELDRTRAAFTNACCELYRTESTLVPVYCQVHYPTASSVRWAHLWPQMGERPSMEGIRTRPDWHSTVKREFAGSDQRSLRHRLWGRPGHARRSALISPATLSYTAQNQTSNYAACRDERIERHLPDVWDWNYLHSAFNSSGTILRSHHAWSSCIDVAGLHSPF